MYQNVPIIIYTLHLENQIKICSEFVKPCCEHLISVEKSIETNKCEINEKTKIK